MGKTRHFKHRKYENLWMNNKVRNYKTVAYNNAVAIPTCYCDLYNMGIVHLVISLESYFSEVNV